MDKGYDYFRGYKTIEWLKSRRDPRSPASIVDSAKGEIDTNSRLQKSREYRDEAEGSWNE